MKIILTIIILLITINTHNSQTKKELEEKRKKTIEEINYLNNLINQTKQKQKLSLNQLIILKKQINARERLIEALDKEINVINKKIENLNIRIQILEKNLSQLKKAYKEMIIFAYKTKTLYDKIYYIFSDDDFNKAYRRFRYLQYYGQYRETQIRKIQYTKKELYNVIEQLNNQKKQKELLKSEVEAEKQKLARDKSEQDALLNKLKKDEKKLLKKLEEQKLAAKKLQEAIQKLIAEEIKKSKEREEKKHKELGIKNEKKPTVSPEITLTPEEKNLNANFENNKNLLPWPTEKGIITSQYGEHEHPVLKGITIRNDGIQITTLPESNVRAVFDGIVSNVIYIPGKNNVIIIKHGNYYTVYANLKDIMVKKGDKVKTKQIIGKAATDNEENKTFVEFQIWKNNIKLNPEEWLAVKK
ncbi:MAG: peptidoglycan DD-metalloendopeptidase family protein [Bacteroidales bacterium]|nr:peptidoglycan DD-metalloendopeptidase family protein [Bacteroidales bacterium]